MKKHNFLSKSLSLALMLVMLVSLAAVGVSANPTQAPNDNSHYVGAILPLDKNGTYSDPYWNFGYDWVDQNADGSLTVKRSDYDKFIQPWLDEGDGTILELSGMGFAGSLDAVVNDKGEIVIPAFPKDGTAAEKDAWNEQYWGGYRAILMTYLFHKHDLNGSPFYADDNHHWKLCTQCAKRVFLHNHTDKNEDDKCDYCGNPIRYYNVTVKECAGGKVTVSAPKGAMYDQIKVTVTPDAGYHLDTLKFFNNNALHSQLARYEDKPGAEYHFIVANWDIDVEAAFVKD